jgi:MbtH protein
MRAIERGSGIVFDDETIDYFVVVNDEEQYSIWPAQRDLPNGWRAIGPPRPRAECLDYIEQVWTDIRPKSVREAIAREQGAGGGAR